MVTYHDHSDADESTEATRTGKVMACAALTCVAFVLVASLACVNVVVFVHPANTFPQYIAIPLIDKGRCANTHTSIHMYVRHSVCVSCSCVVGESACVLWWSGGVCLCCWLSVCAV